MTFPPPGATITLADDTLVVRGTTTDNGTTKRVVVNGVEAKDVDYNFHRWEVKLRGVRPGKLELTAFAEDEAGNVEQTPHRMAFTVLSRKQPAAGPRRAAGNDAPAPIYAKGAALQVEWIKRIWSQGAHNAFPDVERFGDKWFVATREGTAHGISGFGRVRVISSDDGERWRSVGLFDGFGDYRRGELSVTGDGRLMLTSKFNRYGDAGAAKHRTFQAQDHQGKEREVFTRGVENHVAFSNDGVRWTKMTPVEGTHPSAWFYSGVQWLKNVGYAIDRQGRKLYRTRDGVHFEAVSDVPVGNESRISFLPDQTMIVFFRNGSLAASPPPYSKWTVNQRNTKGPHSCGGPGVIALPNKEVWAASRHRINPREFRFPPEDNQFPDGTVLFKMEGDRLAPQVLIRGGGDRGYNGLVWHKDFLWMVYNAPSRRPEGRASTSQRSNLNERARLPAERGDWARYSSQ